ncbi:MAG: L,D-transpeptidase family protein [Helicobacteraceae bacterium]|nr:L,D-transpeptidase family protein [Helicobacteraceae bacterium]
MIKKLTLLFALTTSAFSVDYIDLYLNKGIDPIEKSLDRGLTNKKYWQEKLKSQDTTFGYFQNLTSLLVCDKQKGSLKIYKKSKNANSKFKLLKKHDAFTGQKDGDKIEEGDLKTPVGVYRLRKRLDKVDSFYGPLAFVTSYPNVYDKIRGKTGHGIWIHGLPFNQERDEYTKGCIAIGNDNIECMDRNIDIKTSLLLIDDSVNIKVNKESLASILSGVFAWRYAWLYNDIDTYLSFYHSKFSRFDGVRKVPFSAYKKRVFAKKESKRIIFKNIAIVPYPGEKKGLFMITFDESYITKTYIFNGEKTLIAKLDKNNNFRILAEQ